MCVAKVLTLVSSDLIYLCDDTSMHTIIFFISYLGITEEMLKPGQRNVNCGHRFQWS